MSDAAADSFPMPPRAQARPAPPPVPYRGPVFIGDALTPLGGTTLLALLWPRERD